jgi:F-type H+-transporting ATPase subunit delta
MADIATIARPYAKAIFNLGEDLEVWVESLKTLVSIHQTEGFLTWVSNPKTTKEQASTLIKEALGHAKFNPSHIEKVMALVAQLLERHRFILVEQISEQFVKLWQKSQEVIQVKIESAFDLSPTQEEDLKNSLEKNLGKKVKIENILNTQLIGGVKIYVDDTVLDYSATHQLSRLKSAICAAS